MTAHTRHDRTIAWLIFFLLLACYLVTYTGTIQSSDGLAMFSTAESLVRYGGIDSNQLQWIGFGQGLYGPDGSLYSGKGLGMTLLSAPLVWLARLWPAVGLVQAVVLVNPLLTAWTGALIYLAGRLLGWRRGVTILTALLYGLATPAWPYSQTYFSDPVSAWGLFLTFYLLLCYGRSRRPAHLVFAGVVWGLAYLTRPINLLTLPLYAGLLVYILEPAGIRAILEAIQARRRPDSGPWREYLKRDRDAWLSFALPVIEAGVLSLLWNWARYGNVWEIGYASDAGFYGDWLFGLWGLIGSPGRGILWYAPALWLAVIGVLWFWRERRCALVFCLSLSALYIAVYAGWFCWHGGYAWGPRFLVSVVPFLALLCGPALERLLPGMNDQGEALEKPAPMLRPYHGAREAIKRVSIWFLIGISVGVQWLGMLIPFRFVQGHLITLAYPHFLPETFNRPAWSPLVLQWKFITPENVHFAWWQGGAIDPWALALPLAGVAAGATLLLLTARRGERLLLRRAGAIYGAGMLAIILVMLLRLQLPLSGVVNVALTNEIERSERAGDAIMHLAHVETQKFANVYHGRLPAYGLEEQATIYPGEEMRVGIFMERHDRFWVVSEGRDSEWEQELTAHGGTLVSERWFGEGDTARRLALYEMGE